MGKISIKMRRWSRSIHRHLSYFFSGVLILYAVSGLFMNHAANPREMRFDKEVKEYTVKSEVPANPRMAKHKIKPKTKPDIKNKGNKNIKRNVKPEEMHAVLNLLDEIGERDNYDRHYFLKGNILRISLKEEKGSNLEINLDTKEAKYTKYSKRTVVGPLVNLHSNIAKNKWWIIFSDISMIAILIIIITGFVMMKGHKGLIGIGGIELLLGIAIPLAFLFII